VPTAPTPLLLGLQSLTTEELLALLLRFELAEPLLRQLKERELTGALANCWPNRDTPPQSPSNDGAMALYRRRPEGLVPTPWSQGQRPGSGSRPWPAPGGAQGTPDLRQ